MRDINFRAYYEGRYYHFVELTSYKDGSMGVMLSDTSYHRLFTPKRIYILEQYTVFKDKNDKKVCEGDLFKMKGTIIYEVYFENGSFCVRYLMNDNTFYKWGALSRLFDNDMIDLYQHMEIIGNIHENQELLN